MSSVTHCAHTTHCERLVCPKCGRVVMSCRCLLPKRDKPAVMPCAECRAGPLPPVMPPTMPPPFPFPARPALRVND